MPRALRTLARAPAIAAIVVAVLALGIGSVTAMFSVLNAVLLRSLPYHQPERLFEIRTTDQTGRESGLPLADFDRVRALPGIAAISFSASGAVTLTGPEGAENVFGERLAGDGLAVYGVNPALGRLANGDRDAVISHRLWQRRFRGDANIVGRAIVINGEAWTIGAVMPPQFASGNPIFEMWTPWRFTREDLEKHRGYNGNTIIRLTEGVPAAQLAARVERESLGANKNLHPKVETLRDRYIGDPGPVLWTLLGAVGLVLLIACLNAGSLLLARALAGRQETAVRAALGASRWQLLGPVLAESAVLSIGAALCGTAVAWTMVHALTSILPERVPLPRLEQTSIDAWALAVALVATTVSVFAATLAPALAALRVRPAAALGERSGTGTRGAQRFRAGAVILQTALSVILLTGAGLLLRSLAHMLETDPGYRREGILTARIPMPFELGQRGNESHDAHYRAVLEAVRAIPGVRDAAITTVLPLGRVSASISFAAEGRPTRNDEYVQFQAISPDYFRVMGIRLLAGRFFDERDTATAPGVMIVNDVTARKYWPGEDAVGKRVAGNKPVTVVGVVGAIRRGAMREPPGPQAYSPFPQFMFGLHGTTLVARTAGPPPESLAAPLRKLLREQFPNHPVAEVRTMDAVVSDSVAGPRFYAVLLTAFAAIALLLAAAGLYALLAHNVAERRREIGIRLALGATPARIARFFLSRGLALVAVGLLSGAAASAALTRLLRAQLYEVQPGDPVTLALVCVVLLIVGTVAMAAPARRAARVDPACTLRAE
ncbi:MAG: ADOP family duplicated permease [Bryobacteraceae bacterium]